MAQDDSGPEMIQFVVEQVNQVLSRSYSLVQFDELAPTQLLQVLADIFEELSPQTAVDCNSEPQDPGCMRLLEFLCRTLGYKVPPMTQQTFAADFMNAEKTVMYPVLYWVLKRMPENRRHRCSGCRSSFSLTDIPEHLRLEDDDIRELCAHYQQLRSDFIDVHKRVDALKAASADPTEATLKVAIQERELNRLAQQISAGQEKLERIPNKDSLIQACRVLKAEQDENHKLHLECDEQRDELTSGRRLVTELTNRLRYVRNVALENHVEAVVQRVSDDLHTNRMRIDHELSEELSEKRAQVDALSKLLNDPLDLGALHSELTGLDEECAALRQQVAGRQSCERTNIVTVKQQVSCMVKRKLEIQQQLQTVQAEAVGLQDQIRDREGQLDQLRSSPAKIPESDDFKRYCNHIHSKAAASRTMKQRLRELRGVIDALQCTEEFLCSKHEVLQGGLSFPPFAMPNHRCQHSPAACGARTVLPCQQRQHLGLSPGSAMRPALQCTEEFLRSKHEVLQGGLSFPPFDADFLNEVEQLKGPTRATLDELSDVVRDFYKAIDDRRAKLAPLIRELRVARSSARVVEAKWEESKTAYEHVQDILVQEVGKLEADVRSLSDECRLDESSFHRLQCQITAADIHRQRAVRERCYRANNNSTLDSLPEPCARDDVHRAVPFHD